MSTAVDNSVNWLVKPRLASGALGAWAVRATPWLIISLGIGLRLLQYSHDRSLFLDEAFVATNIAHKSYAELLHPLEFDQRAPAAFLLAVKASWITIGSSDFALRLIPLVAGIVAVVMFYFMAGRFVERPAALLATLFFALADTQIFYSSDLKQYSLDVLMTITVLWAFAGFEERPLTLARAVGLGLLGAAALWCSFPAVVVLTAVGACAGVGELARRRWSQVTWLVGVALLWAVGFASVYFYQLRHFDSNPGWKNLWARDFMPMPLWHDAWIKWTYERLTQFLTLGIGLSYAGLALLAYLIGLWAFGKQSRYKLFLLLSPLMVAAGLSALRIYPLGGRVCLYLAPIMALPIANGICFLHGGRDGGVRRAVAATMALLLLIFPIEKATNALHGNLYGNRMFFNYKFEEAKPMMRYIREHWQPGDLVYLYSQSNVAFEHYADRFEFRPEDSVRGIMTAFSNPKWSEIRNDLGKLKGRKRVWIFFTHAWAVFNGVNDEVLFVNYLDAMGRRLDQLDMPSNYGAALYLYDLSEPTS
jgi:hypothetical protein